MEAEPLLKQSLDVREKALGLEHHEVAEVLRKLNRLYLAIGRYDEASAASIRSSEITGLSTNISSTKPPEISPTSISQCSDSPKRASTVRQFL